MYCIEIKRREEGVVLNSCFCGYCLCDCVPYNSWKSSCRIHKLYSAFELPTTYRSVGCRSFCCCCLFLFSSVGKQLEQAYIGIATLLPLPPSLINRMWFMWTLMGTGQCKMDPNLFYSWVWDLGVFQRLRPGELKKYVVTSFWRPVAMETIQDGRQTQLFKSLKLQSHCVQITKKKFTVSANITLSSLLPRISLLLCSSFILLCYLHFMLVKSTKWSNRVSRFGQSEGFRFGSPVCALSLWLCPLQLIKH